MLNLPNYKNIDIKGNDKLVITAPEIGKTRSGRTVTGRVYEITDNFIVLQIKNYRECFSRIDFLTGHIKLVSVNKVKVQ